MDEKLKSFINKVIEFKTLEISKKEFPNIKDLEVDQVLKVDNDKISILDYSGIAKSFLHTYLKILEFEIDKDFQRTAKFLNDVKKDFIKDNYPKNFHLLEKEIWRWAIKESNLKYDSDFRNYLNSIDNKNKPEGIFQFIENYSLELPELNLDTLSIYHNSKKLIEFTQSDAQINISLDNVLKGLKDKCKIDFEQGVELFELFIQEEDENEVPINAITCGLYEIGGSNFFNSHLNALIKKEKSVNAICFGLSNISKVGENDCDLFLKIYSKFHTNEKYFLSQISLIFAIIDSSILKYQEECFDKLHTQVCNKVCAKYIFNRLIILKGFAKEKIDLITHIFSQDFFRIGTFSNFINNFFLYVKDFDSFERIVHSLISNRPFESIAKIFSSYISSVDREKLDLFLIDLLTSNKAEKRFAGLDLLDQISQYQSFNFKINLLNLDPLIQYKLWVSLTQDFNNPENRIPCLLPLLSSNSELVRESFIYKLEELSEDYGNHIPEILNNFLERDNNSHQQVIDRIKNFIENYYSINVNAKDKILEFNPYQTQNKYIRLFDDYFNKKMNSSLSEGVRKNSILNVLGTNTVKLAKGGGWKFGHKNEISQLGKVGTKMSLPRSYFIYPDKYEIEKGITVKNDWTNEEFVEIKKMLENE